MIGSTLDGRYFIEALIGTGGMGSVYRGMHTGLHRPFAIKVLRETTTRDDVSRAANAEAFKREAFASGQLDHPNIVSVSDFGALDDGTLYLAMEVLEGESLRARLTRDLRFAWPDAIDIMRGVLGGLAYAHERDIVHCDIKPDNIFLARKHGESFVKLLDFGISKLLDREFEGEDLRHGTPEYVSPEQVVADPITIAVDLYAASVVLYEMLAGTTPFAGLDPQAKLYAHVHAPVPAFDPALGIPARLEEIILAGLAKKPTERIQSAPEFSRMLDGILVATGLVGLTPLVSSPFAIPTPLPGFARAATQPECDPTEPRIRGDSQPRGRAGTEHQRESRTTLVTTISKHPRPRTRTPWIAAGAIVAALAAMGFAVIPHGSATAPVATPAPVVHTQTPAPAADPVLDRVEAAIAQGRIAEPAEDNALALLDHHAGSPRARELRIRAIAVLRASAQLLWDHDKKDSARICYADLSRYDATDAVERARALPPTRASKPAPAPTAAARQEPAQVAFLISQIDLAIVEHRFVSPAGHNALEDLLDLRKIDPQNAVATQRGTEIANALTTEAIKRPSEATTLLSAAKRARGDARAETSQLAASKDLDAKARAELSTGKTDQAKATFQRAIDANSNDHVAYAGLAEVAFDKADFQRSVLLAKRAVELAPAAVTYRMILAKAYYKLMRFDDAIAQWKKVLEREPTNELARQNIKIAQAKGS